MSLARADIENVDQRPHIRRVADIRVMYWYHPADYWKFLDFSQRLNLQICQAFEAQKIRLLLPSRITYSPSDDSRSTTSGTSN